MTQVAVFRTKRDEREAAGPFNGVRRSLMWLPAEGAVDLRESTWASLSVTGASCGNRNTHEPGCRALHEGKNCRTLRAFAVNDIHDGMADRFSHQTMPCMGLNILLLHPLTDALCGAAC